MEKISLLNDKIINCLKSAKMQATERNSILEQLYQQSNVTRSQFVEEMKQLVRRLNDDVNANILRIIAFDKYLKNKTVTYTVSGTVFSNDWNSTKTKIVSGLVHATSEAEAQQLFCRSWQYDSKWHSAEADDFSAIEMSYKEAESNLLKDKSYQRHLNILAKQRAAV
jgi:hypothetical protein